MSTSPLVAPAHVSGGLIHGIISEIMTTCITHLDERCSHRLEVVRQESVEELENGGAEGVRYLAHNAEVDEPHAAILQDQQVAGMDVRVEDIVGRNSGCPCTQSRNQRALGRSSVSANAFQINQWHT